MDEISLLIIMFLAFGCAAMAVHMGYENGLRDGEKVGVNKVRTEAVEMNYGQWWSEVDGTNKFYWVK